MISSRVCAPPVAVRSTAGPSCAQAGLKISDASTRAAAPNRRLFIRVLQRNQQEGVVTEEVPELGELRNFVQISLCTFLLVGCAPSPGAGTETTVHHALAIDVRHLVAVTGKQGFGRAHFRTDRQFTLCNTVAAVLGELGCGIVFFRAACTERAFVHFAAAAKVARLRELGRTERAGVETIATTDTQVLGMQDRKSTRLNSSHVR